MTSNVLRGLACFALPMLALTLALSTAAQQAPNKGNSAQPKGAAVPEAVKVERDLEYAKAGDKKLLLDLYLPEKAKGALPVIVGIHGGGWANGSKAGGQGSWLSRHGYAVAVINYRLSGEAIFPAQIEDCKAAVRWLRANAKKYNLDPDRFGATGHSAGGHLASLLATTGDVKEFDKGENLKFSSRLQAACPLSGPTDLLQMDAHAPKGARLKHDAPNSPEARLIGGAIQENKEKAAKANPITYVTKDDPPFLIVHGDQDATVPAHQAPLLFDSLKSAGIAVHLHTVKGGGHGVGGREVNDKVLAFFDKHLKGDGPVGKPTAETSESQGSDGPPKPGGNRPLPPGLTWNRIRDREDTNKDGKVTKEEIKGPPALFDQLDRNRDGTLTKEDFVGAPPAKEPAKEEPKPIRPPQPAAEKSQSEEPTEQSSAKPSSTVQQPVGLFVCRGPGPTPEKEVNFPFIDGWLVRPGWDKVEPEEGKFDWAYIDHEIALAKRLKKNVTLAVLGGPQAPEWVYRAGATSFGFRFGDNRKYGKKSDREVKLPVLWDETYLAKWTALVRALGKRYGSEEAVALIHITGATGNGLEMQLPFGPDDRKNWDRLGYTPGKAIKAWQSIIDAYAGAFTNKPLDIDIHPVLGSEMVASEVAAYGSKKLGSRFGIFGDWLYGDAVEELDFHTGRLLAALDELRLRDTTLVIFTSDNGTWSNNADRLRERHNGEIAWGSSGPLREAKGSTYEGGLRVPCIVRWPGHVPAGRVSDAIFATIDFLPTFGKLAGFTPPGDRIIDGLDQTDLLLGRTERGAREHFHYFCQNELHAVRQGPWKLVLFGRKVFYNYVKDRGSNEAELYNLENDIGEKNNVAREHPDIVARLQALANSFVWPEQLLPEKNRPPRFTGRKEERCRSSPVTEKTGK